jgi:hypothetical protein
MFGRIVSAVVMVLCLFGLSGGGVVAQREGTFGISIGAHDCDSDPRENPDANCAPSVGTVMTVSAGGELIGQCTVEAFNTPYGGIGSGCAVDGVPFNSTVYIYEDISSLRFGYEPINNPEVLVTTDVIPGGGDGPVVDFINVLKKGSGGKPPVVYRSTSISGGTCSEVEQIGYYPLNPVVIAEGDPVGQPVAIEAETMYQTFDRPLDILIDEPQAIVVHETLDSQGPIIACGEIGGVNDHDGELVIGLHEMNDSGFVGMAKLSYNAEDTEKTDIAVYLAQGLEEES